MKPKPLTPTGLTLDQDSKGGVPPGIVVVPKLEISREFTLVTTEPMIFQDVGDKSTRREVRLLVRENAARKSAVVAPDTAKELATGLGGLISARRLSRFERLRSYGKAEVVLAVIALLMAITAIVGAAVIPSADHAAGRADLAGQIQPIEQRLSEGLHDGNGSAVKQADAQLREVLAAHGHRSDAARTIPPYSTLGLGILSTVLAVCIAVKRAKSTV